MKAIKNLYKRIFGEIRYVVTILCVGGEVQKLTTTSLKDVDKLCEEINSETYQQIQKIEKIRVYDFQYKKEIIHSPLFFSIDGVTEQHQILGTKLSFVCIDKSLVNVKRVRSKNP